MIWKEEGRNKIFTTFYIFLMKLNFWFVKDNNLRFIKRIEKHVNYVNIFVIL